MPSRTQPNVPPHAHTVDNFCSSSVPIMYEAGTRIASYATFGCASYVRLRDLPYLWLRVLPLAARTGYRYREGAFSISKAPRHHHQSRISIWCCQDKDSFSHHRYKKEPHLNQRTPPYITHITTLIRATTAPHQDHTAQHSTASCTAS
jgi:hypothetical protein